MKRKMNLGIDTNFLKREGLRFELMKSEYNCYTQHQKRDIIAIMSTINLNYWKMDDIRDLIKNEVFKKNIDCLRYIYLLRNNSNKQFFYFAIDLIYKLISTIREGNEIDFDLVVKMFEGYAQNGSHMHGVEVLELIESLIFDKKYNGCFTASTKLRLFNCTIHSTEKGESLGYELLHIYKLCEKRDVSERRVWFNGCKRTSENSIGLNFDSFEAFGIVEKAYEGFFDDDPTVADLINQSFSFVYSAYSVDENLLEYSKEAFDEAVTLFKTLSERLNKGGCSQEGSVKYWKG